MAMMMLLLFVSTATTHSVEQLGMRLLGVPRHVILAPKALGAVGTAELPVARVDHATREIKE